MNKMILDSVGSFFERRCSGRGGEAKCRPIRDGQSQTRRKETSNMVVGGLIADRLLDMTGETGNGKKSLAKSLGSTVAKNVAEALLSDVELKPKPKAKGTKKDLVKPQRPDPTGLTAKLRPKPKRRITKKSPPEEEEVQHMDTRIGSQKREETDHHHRIRRSTVKTQHLNGWRYLTLKENNRQEQDQRQRHQHHRLLHQHQHNQHKRKDNKNEGS